MGKGPISPHPLGRTLTPDQQQELRRLYDLLAEATAAAEDAMGEPSGLPDGLASERFKMLDDRVSEIVARINAILDRLP